MREAAQKLVHYFERHQGHKTARFKLGLEVARTWLNLIDAQSIKESDLAQIEHRLATSTNCGGSAWEEMRLLIKRWTESERTKQLLKSTERAIQFRVAHGQTTLDLCLRLIRMTRPAALFRNTDYSSEFVPYEDLSFESEAHILAAEIAAENANLSQAAAQRLVENIAALILSNNNIQLAVPSTTERADQLLHDLLWVCRMDIVNLNAEQGAS